MPHGARQNKTPPVSDSVLQPLLAAALYLTGTIGPHATGLLEQVRDADRKWSVKHGDHVLSAALPAEEITRVLEGYKQRGEPLPLADEHVIRNRLEAGWPPGDPLARLSLGLIARQAGFTQFWSRWMPDMRSRIEEALDIVGAEKPFGRGSPPVDRADGEGAVPWTLPLDRLEAVALTGIVRTASLALRYRLASKVVKGQPLGGTPDEWVVIEPAYQAAQLLVRLHDDPGQAIRCWDGSRSTSAGPGSGTGSTAPPASGSASPPSRTTRSASGPCAEPWQSSSPTGPAGSWPRNCT
jgi:hypothetical protein